VCVFLSVVVFEVVECWVVTFSVTASSKLGVSFKAHCHYYSFAVTAKSDRKRARPLAAGRQRTQPFCVSTRHILMDGDLCRTDRPGSAAFFIVVSSVLPHAFALPAIVAGWSWCATRAASAAVADTATTTDRFSHGRRGFGVRYACTIINAHHVS